MFIDYKLNSAAPEDGNIHFYMGPGTYEEIVAKHKAEFNLSDGDFINVIDPIKNGTFPCCPRDEIMHHKIVGDQVVFCPDKARTNFKNKMREQRSAMFTTLDALSIQNIERGADNSHVIKQKQLLRDMPKHPKWNTLQTLDDFKNLTLDSLLSTSTQ